MAHDFDDFGLGNLSIVFSRARFTDGKSLKSFGQVSTVALLPGWQDSVGARLEITVALACDIPVTTVAELLQAKADGLPAGLIRVCPQLDFHLARLADLPVDQEEHIATTCPQCGRLAKRYLYADRITCDHCDNQPPENILQEAERLIYADRNDQYGHPAQDMGRTAGMATALLADKLNADLTAADICQLMILVKLSRERHHPKRDNRTDGAGYFGCLDRIETHTKEEAA